MPTYQKHLIECNCILPQFSKMNPPIFHKFPVFSAIQDDGKFVEHYAQCNNCNMIHKVFEIHQSKTMGKETLKTLPTKEEIKESLPENYSSILEKYECDLLVWQEVQFVLENKLWGKNIILTKEEMDGNVLGKSLLIIGETMLKINNFSFQKDL